MDKYEIERKLKELDEKFRRELTQEKLEMVRNSYKSASEMCSKVKEEIRRDIQKSLQDELLTTKKDNFFLNRQIHQLQTQVDALKWESRRQDRKMREYVDYLKSLVRDLDTRLQKFEQSDILEPSPQMIRRAS